MDGDRITMSQRERDRLKVMAPVLEGKRTQAEAARLLQVTERTIRRWVRRVQAEGDRGIRHRLRERPSNRRKSPTLRRRILQVYRQEYGDFGPTLACEKLQERALSVGRETLRQWLLEESLWQPQRKRDKHRQRRERRPCFGEMVQGDGSHHDWLEGRGPQMVLVAFLDDATSKATACFYPAETTEAYMDLLGRYLRKRGRMASMYVDRDSIFRAECPDPSEKRPAPTQFSRALTELGIELILAFSPQAKGRIERFFQTAQDRLVKELRLAKARTLAEANRVLETVFLPWFNRTRNVRAGSPNDAHRPLHPSMRLESILSIQERRKVCNDYTIRLENRVYQIHKPALPGLRGGWVIVEKRPDQSLAIRLKRRYLAFHRIEPARRTGALPPDPRSLSPGQTPAERRKKEGPAVSAARPSAVRLAARRSGRTPAEPCPPGGKATVPPSPAACPRPGWAWRNFHLPGSPPNRTILSGGTTGQF
jgi:transposase